MLINSDDAYSILGVVGGEKGAIISKSGILTISFEMVCPEAYSLHSNDYEKIHNEFYKAFKNMPDNSYVHKQDVFLKKKFKKHLKDTSFINKAENEHFLNREYIEHRCILSFSLSSIEGLEPQYFSNPVLYKEKISEKSRRQIEDFIDSVEGAESIIKNMPNFGISQMSEQQIRDYIFDYCNGFRGDNSTRDIHFAESMYIGDQQASVFAITEDEFLPNTISSVEQDETLRISNNQLFMSELEQLGVHLLCNHVYNQILWFPGNENLKDALDFRVKKFGQHQEFMESIKTKYEQIKTLRDEVFKENKILCKASFNLILWDEDKDVLNNAENKVKDILRIREYKYYRPSFEGLQNIWIGSVLGRENKLSNDYYFLTELDIPICLFTKTTAFKSDDEGVFFNDRIYQVPIRKDIWDAKKKRIPARNAIVVASTGGGKSACTENIVQQIIEDGTKTIVCEFGKSFEQLTHLYPDVSMHIDYDGESPLGINPFNLCGKSLDKIKLVTLVEIIFKFWRVPNISADTNQRVSLTKIVEDYYKNIKEGHSFPDFYLYVKSNYKQIIERQGISEDYFDIASFLHICSEFLPGGIYENVCKIGDNEKNIMDKDFIVFELTKIKKDPFLASLIMTILYDTIENKILSDKTVRGELIFDEYAETQSMKDDSNGGVHPTVAFCYQKMRKDNGAIMTIIQSPAQLPDNEYTKNIISNTQILYVLPTTEVVYSQVIEAFEIKNQAHINLMKSINNDFYGERPHSEIYIRMQDKYNVVVRLEFSKPKFYAFQTDSEDWQAIHNDYLITGNMEESITKYIKLKEKK